MVRKKFSYEFSSMVVLILSVLASALGVVFQSLSGHLLNNTQLYAELNAVMAVFNILVLPTTAASCFISKYTAEIHAQGGPTVVKGFLEKTVKVLAVFAIVFGGVLFCAYKPISRWLNIEDSTIIIFAVILAVLTIFSAVFTGGLQGSKAFVLYGIFGLIGPVYKIVAIVSSVLYTRKLVGILVVWIVGTLLSYLAGAFLLKKALGSGKSAKVTLDLQKVKKYIIKIFVANAGVILLSNIDILLVKHGFDSEAGLYSAARMVGYCITYLANAFVVVLFPIVAEGTQTEKEKLNLLKKTLIYDILLSVIAAIVLVLFFDLGIKILLGTEYLECKKYLLPVMLYVLPISLLNLLANYGMAIGRTVVITSLLFVCSGTAVIGGMLINTSLMTLMWYMSVVMWVAVGGSILYVFKNKKGK